MFHTDIVFGLLKWGPFARSMKATSAESPYLMACGLVPPPPHTLEFRPGTRESTRYVDRHRQTQRHADRHAAGGGGSSRTRRQTQMRRQTQTEPDRHKYTDRHAGGGGGREERRRYVDRHRQTQTDTKRQRQTRKGSSRTRRQTQTDPDRHKETQTDTQGGLRGHEDRCRYVDRHRQTGGGGGVGEDYPKPREEARKHRTRALFGPETVSED